ncbi:NADPH-dependent oxidoreductase [Chromobacterium subtsugae]|uniref:NADPH-dependent oxidoreductase n=1 Tax=Chromobacterium subtsugae TaxID=251747 RepID=A0ABS7FIW5_9NEIS|nr:MULTISPECIES: NADPH-dependent oxidoreductase [Chromobacterium]KUM01931.1 FMN reductase [Chromobacterium subtsugae]KZE86505.1 NADPH-dependent oxidoreductase [Chromobacterium sp. F49]MBW7568962.1 NADPH-dependent oxidoreductase [Chromobacterium subtsugae]MBW8290025.1 NADPH-dependent oxidoreductase [Chromobacterium subtsugae]OBU88316.1 FMN reductase [Chromobacterium subtsugae]
MNETLQLMQQHRSVRSYQDKPISQQTLDAVLDAAWKGPTSINGQQVSLVVVQDAEQRQRIAEIAGGQPWIAQAPVFIAVVIDFHKTRLGVEMAGAQQTIHNSVEAFAVGAVDAGIALGNLMTAARSAGLGVVPIGGIRRDPQAMIELLQLPELTFPLVGLALGHPDQEGSVKPRLPRDSFVHNGQYQAEALPGHIAAYDETLRQYWQDIGRGDGEPWSRNTAGYYRNVYFPKVAPVARSQGFGFDQ